MAVIIGSLPHFSEVHPQLLEEVAILFLGEKIRYGEGALSAQQQKNHSSPEVRGKKKPV